MKKLALVALLATLSRCGGNRSGAEEAVRAILKDPESARFGNFYYNDKTHKGCLTVNARNSMGGYTGDQQAYVEKGKDGWKSDYISDVSLDICRSIQDKAE